MLNQPHNSLRTDGGRETSVGGHPGFRLVCLFAVLLLPAGAILARLVRLQTRDADAFVSASEQTIEFLEPIPARNGRILADDGRVLAEDLEEFHLDVRYRWIEEPPDPVWLRQQAFERLGRKERTDPEEVATAEADVLAERKRLWERLAALGGMTHDELTRERAAIQRRVERIVRMVEARRREKRRSEDADRLDENASWSKRLITALTTEPSRPVREPVLVTEELDFHTVLTSLGKEQAARVRTHPDLFPGTRVVSGSRRVYPEGPLAAHTVGYRVRIPDETFERFHELFPDGHPLGYKPGDTAGATGIERSYDRHLRGVPGLRRIVTTRGGEVVVDEIVRQPRPGRDLVLTLSIPLQRRAEEILDAALKPKLSAGQSDGANEKPRGAGPQGGCLIALDVDTGAVLAMASAPRFDLNLFVDHDPAEWEAVTSDPRHPLVARGRRMAVAPGSVFKTLTSIAVLESGDLPADEAVYCRGYLDRPDRHRCYHSISHGDVTLSDAICRSCNVYFFTAGRRMGPEPLVRWGRRFGFGAPTGIDLPGERSGNLPAPPALRYVASDEPWYPGETLGLAIGQARLAVTPLQVARMMAAVANDGELVTPHVVRERGTARLEDRDGAFADSERPGSTRIRELSPETLATVREGLKRVVGDPRGTGYRHVRLKEVAVAGKTGTAEVGGGRKDNAWFAGFVPADAPRVAFVVVLERAGSGGANAGPLAKELVQAMLDLGLVEGENKVDE